MSGIYGLNIKMSIYGESHGKAVGVVVIGALLFAAGWFLYQPVYDWVMNLERPGSAQTPEDPQSQSSSEEVHQVL